MTTLNELESLNNKELRARCLEFGLPNVPITETSRKLLVRRLFKAINGDGGDPKEKTKNRRETIHHIKIPIKVPANSSEDVKVTVNKTVNRRTIAVAASENIEPSQESVTNRAGQINQRRRSGRVTPLSQQSEDVVTSTGPTIADILEDSDDDLMLSAVAEQSKLSQTLRNRTSRSPSLSKSVTWTTSYKPVHPQIPEVIPEPVIQIQDSDEEEGHEEVQEAPIIRKTIPASPYKPLFDSLNAMKESPAIKPSIFSPPRSNRSDAERVTSTRHLTQTTLTKHATRSDVDEPKNYSFSSRGNYENYANAGRHPTSSGKYNFASPASTSSAFAGTEYSDENADTDKIDSPYLSDFTRRLSRLKTDSIEFGISDLKKEISLQRDIPLRYNYSSYARRPQNPTIAQSFRRWVIAVDRKYNLKRVIIILAAVILAAFIYIFFLK